MANTRSIIIEEKKEEENARDLSTSQSNKFLFYSEIQFIVLESIGNLCREVEYLFIYLPAKQ